MCKKLRKVYILLLIFDITIHILYNRIILTLYMVDFIYDLLHITNGRLGKS
jgi:hypothetical protein